MGRTDLWDRPIAFQVPLHERQARDGWGHIDLLALSSEGSPIVVELKKQNAQDTPLRAMVEGLANAVAVQENWAEMSGEIRDMCARRRLGCTVAEAATPVRLVVLAPRAYWDSWQQNGALGRAVGHAARGEFRRFRGALEERGYPTRLGAFDWPFEGNPRVRPADVDW